LGFLIWAVKNSMIRSAVFASGAKSAGSATPIFFPVAVNACDMRPRPGPLVLCVITSFITHKNEQTTTKSQQAAQWSLRLANLKKAKTRDDQAIEEAQAKFTELPRESRDLAAKAKEIDDAVYDLKAVNPHKKPVVDERTPEQLLNIIEAKGKEITAALAVLWMGGDAIR